MMIRSSARISSRTKSKTQTSADSQILRSGGDQRPASSSAMTRYRPIDVTACCSATECIGLPSTTCL